MKPTPAMTSNELQPHFRTRQRQSFMHRNSHTCGTSLCALASLVFGVLGGMSAMGQVTPGNLIVERIGDGSGALASAGTAAFLNQYTTTGSAGATIAIPTTGGTRLVNSGTATSEGLVTVSPSGLVLNIAGYDAAIGTASIASTAGTAVPRVVNLITGDGTVTRGGSSSSAFSGNNIRSGISNGTDLWAVGGTTGTVYLGSGAAATVSTAIANQRQIGIFAGGPGSQLYFTTGSGSARGIYAVGSGSPTTAGQTNTVFIDTGATSSPYAYQMGTDLKTVYIADDRTLATGGGIQKWTSTTGLAGSFSLAYTFGSGAGLTAGSRGLTVDWSNPNAPVLYATSADTGSNKLLKIADTGSGATSTTLATSATNTAFRGVQLGLLPSVWTKAAADGSTLDWNTSTVATQNSNWSTIQAGGSNIAFQNVNAGTSALNLTISNTINAPITNASSLEFKSGGYGGGSGNTLYTIIGTTGVTLSGTAATSAVGTFTANAPTSTTFTNVVGNNSGVTQTVNIPLTLGAASHAFRAQSGNLNVNGTVNNGGFTLAIAGAAHTIFGSSAVISGSGGLAKVDAGTLSIWSASSYAGATDVYSGTLLVNGSTSSNATTTVASGATLGGKGAIAGAVTISGTLAPGDSIESLSTGALIMSSGSTLAYEANAPGGLGADLIVANGALALNNVTLDLSAATLHTGWIAGTKITLISYTGTAITSGFAGYVDDTQYAFGSNNWLFDYNDTSSGANFQSEASGTSFVTMTLIPEPSAAMLTGLGLGALLFLRRRRSHSV